jgi:hypothetical protein
MRWYMPAAVRRMSLAALVLLGGIPLLAADLRTDIVVLINPLQRQGETFRQLIADAARYKLERVGLTSEVVAATSQEADRPLPKERGALAALVCRYAVQDGIMDVTLGWYDTESNASAAVVQTSGQIDLKLDNVILSALDQILAKVRDRIQSMPGYHKETAVAATPVVTAGTSVPTGVTVITPAAAAPSRGSPRRLLFSGGFAPFLPTGAGAYYFSLGYLPSLLASFFIDTPVGPLGLGLYVGMDYFTAIGTQDYADTYLLPMGVDVRYELGASSLRPFFHLSGGPALMIMVTGAQGTVTSILPFLKSGVGLRLAITQTFGVSVLADYDVYFAMPYLLMGFSPSASVEVRL